jgi:hypothetical protein
MLISRQDIASDNSQYCMRIGRTNSATNVNAIGVAYQMETADSIPLRTKQVTLSFRIRKSATFSASVDVSIVYGTGTDQGLVTYTGWTGQTSIAKVTPTLTTSFVTYSITGTVPVGANQIAVIFQSTAFSASATTSDYFEISQVQLEAGSLATPFEQRPYGMELALCQRYYQIASPMVGKWISTTNIEMNLVISPPMRATPTLSLAAGSTVNEPGVALRLISAVPATGVSVGGGEIGVTTVAATNGAMGFIGYGVIICSAEL